ncbi:DegV family protein [Vagococcus acidifermentans]|uniref:Fatty acid-binding protein DegV n=1 Tax=Vagococcus acidifermentans TaxID=564710 RepID=A0A430AXY2_9ENTE|nr:DegV family protein [Vagococcus acidifermentans]RSU12917.1 fatty acid-binding protein DegV [Vagococcus acidifermentans]
MKTAIVTDSTAFLRESYKDKENLFTVPIPVILDGQMYREDVDIQAEEYYTLLKQSKDFPKTSQPAIGEVIELYKQIAAEGYDAIVSIHLSSGISGFVNTLASFADSIEEIDVYPFDSLITSGPMGFMVETALDMAEEHKSPQEILQALTEMREGVHAYLIVDDLNNLVRGGRLKNGAAIIGTLLKIKPILRFDNGAIVLHEKIRSMKKALQRSEEIVLDHIGNDTSGYRVNVIHANNLELAIQERDSLLAKYPDMDVDICYFGPVIGTHLGEKAIAIGFSPKVR